MSASGGQLKKISMAQCEVLSIKISRGAAEKDMHLATDSNSFLGGCSGGLPPALLLRCAVPCKSQEVIIPLSKTKETNVLFAGFRKMRYAESDESWVLS